jgi:DNA-binding LacI/PurR family transcriptional regulator
MKSNTSFDFNIQRADPLPVYLQFKKQLKANIRRKKLTPGTKLPSIDELAASADIGVKTAYKGLSELIKERVCFKRPKKGTFVADDKGSNVATKKICCIYHSGSIADIERNIILASIYRGLQENASERGIDIFFLTGDPVDSLEFYLANDKIELTGVIMLEWDCYKEGVRLADIFPDIRFVYVNYHSEEFDETPRNIYGIFNDDFSGAFQVGSYMVQGGHKHLAVLSLPLIEDNYRKRIEGFKQALLEADYDLDSQLQIIREPLANFNNTNLRQVGHCLAAKAFSKAPYPTALFVVNDVLALGAHEYLIEHDLRSKVELFGYDNIFQDLSKDNNFSTVAIDFQRMGRKAIDLIGGTKSYSSKYILLNPQLLIRRSNFEPENK